MLLLSAFALASDPTSTVYLMRHCARSTYSPDLYGGQEPEYLANYSDGGDLPDWGVAPTLCTARGRVIIEGQGRSLREEVLGRMGGPDATLKVIYDSGSKRDNTTALDFLKGLGLPVDVRKGEANVFTPPTTWCPAVTAAAKETAVREQLASMPKPPKLEERVAALQELLGKGAAPPMQEIADTVSGGAVGWIGGTFVASSWIEAMLLQLGAGLPMAYGRVTPAMLYELLELHVYYRAIADRGFAIEQRGESNLLAHMLADLSAPCVPSKGCASVYVGHDTNLDGIAVMLGLQWPHAPPYPANTTVPGATLRLTTTGVGASANVSAAFLYTQFENASGVMAEVEALFGNGLPTISLAELTSFAEARIDQRCVRLGWAAPAVEQEEAA